jgi:hypothetical protein
MSTNWAGLAEEVDYLAAERKLLAAAGPQMKIFHRIYEEHYENYVCSPGEQVEMIVLSHRCKEFPLRLSLASSILLDFLARNKRTPMSAAQIEARMRSDLFCLEHGSNAKTTRRLTRKFRYSTIKEYVKRLRQSIGDTFDEVGLKLSPRDTIRSLPTEGNQVLYQLRSSIEWIHRS